MFLGACSLGYVIYSSRAPLKPATGYLSARPHRVFRRKVSFYASELPLYLSLDLTQDIIRLLVVNPGHGNEDIHCLLEEVSLDRNPTYTALSYTWGSPIRRSASLWTYRGMHQYLRELYERVLPHSPTILLDGKRVPVTPNLESALQHLRKPDLPLMIWVDAVCINQGNNEEKEHEVNLMHKIYTQAETTYVWLGDAADESDKAMDFIAASTNLDVMDPGFKIHHIAPPWSALQALFARSWWSRVWVIQEALLSKNVVVKCGHKEVPFDSFSRLAEKENKLRRRLRTDPTFGGSHALKARWTFMPPTTPFYTILGIWFPMRKALEAEMGIPLWEGLVMTSLFNATVPRDRIYGVLGLMLPADRAAITVDYTAQKSDREVFKEAVAHVIKSRDHLLPLQLVQPRKVLDLPSWAPDLSHPNPRLSNAFTNFGYTAEGNNATWVRLNHPTLGPLVLDHPVAINFIFKLSSYASSWAKHTLSDSRGAGATLSNNDNTLSLRGISFDTVAFADPAPETQIFQASDAVYLDQDRVFISNDLVPAMLRWEKQVGLHNENPYSTSEGRYGAFWRTLITNRYRGDGSSRGGYIAPPSDYHLAYEFWVGRRSPPRDPKAYSRLNLMVGTFQAMVGRAAGNRAFVITKRGFLGMAPDTTKEGDLVCVFQGGDVPFVVRPKGKHGQWELIGECYVHGIMHGEVVNKAQPKDVDVFHLV